MTSVKTSRNVMSVLANTVFHSAGSLASSSTACSTRLDTSSKSSLASAPNSTKDMPKLSEL